MVNLNISPYILWFGLLSQIVGLYIWIFDVLLKQYRELQVIDDISPTRKLLFWFGVAYLVALLFPFFSSVCYMFPSCAPYLFDYLGVLSIFGRINSLIVIILVKYIYEVRYKEITEDTHPEVPLEQVLTPTPK